MRRGAWWQLPRVYEGSVIPWWAGIVRYEVRTNELIVAPSPFHLVFRLAHWLGYLYWRFIVRADWLGSPFYDAYHAGFTDGYTAGSRRLKKAPAKPIWFGKQE